MALKKHFSEKSLKRNMLDQEKFIKRGMLDPEKSNPLFTFHKLPLETKPNPHIQSLYTQLKFPSYNSIKLPMKSVAIQKKQTEPKFLPPLAHPSKPKNFSSKRELFPRHLLQSDCQPSRPKEYEQSDLLNYSYSEKKASKKSKIFMNSDMNEESEELVQQDEKFLHALNEIDRTPTPTFKSPLEENKLSSTEEIKELKADKVKNNNEQSSVLINTDLMHKRLKNSLNIGGVKAEFDTYKRINSNYPANLKNNRQKIRVLDYRLPKDVFTVNGGNNLRYAH